MGWRNVIITQHSKLSYSSNMMVVHTKDGVSQIPVSDINMLVVLTTQAVITSALIAELAKKQTKVIFVDEKQEPICETENYYSTNCHPEKLIKQFNWDEDRKQILWTKIVAAKIQNQMNVLRIYGLPTDEIERDFLELELNDASNREATTARKYFTELFGKDFKRREGSNALNAALNYGYSILLSAVNRKITMDGNRTYMGVHHSSEHNPFNLGSDLMEPFRPFVDYWLYDHKNIKEFTPDIKYGLVELLSLRIIYNGDRMILGNAINQYVHDCLRYLDGNLFEMNIELEVDYEVPNDAIDDNV